MITPKELEEKLIQMNKEETIDFLMNNNILSKEFKYSFCLEYAKYSKYKKNKDVFAWRYVNKKCNYYKEYFSLCINTFFEGFTSDFSFILRVIIKFLTKQQIFSYILYFRTNKDLIYKIINKFRSIISLTDFSQNKLDGPGNVVQIDETMMNYKCKSLCERSPNNKTDALSIIECNFGI